MRVFLLLLLLFLPPHCWGHTRAVRTPFLHESRPRQHLVALVSISQTPGKQSGSSGQKNPQGSLYLSAEGCLSVVWLSPLLSPPTSSLSRCIPVETLTCHLLLEPHPDLDPQSHPKISALTTSLVMETTMTIARLHHWFQVALGYSSVEPIALSSLFPSLPVPTEATQSGGNRKRGERTDLERADHTAVPLNTA